MPEPVVRHQDPGQTGVSGEVDPEHVPDLPLLPVRGRVDRDGGRDMGVIDVDGDLEPIRRR